MANRKLAKKVYKLIKKASKNKVIFFDYWMVFYTKLIFQGQLRQGLTDVQKAIRKKEQGLVVLAGTSLKISNTFS